MGDPAFESLNDHNNQWRDRPFVNKQPREVNKSFLYKMALMIAFLNRCKRAAGSRVADRPFFQWMDLEPNTAVWFQRFGTGGGGGVTILTVTCSKAEI